MKTTFLKSILVLLIAASFTGCSNDDDVVCAPIACLNGGVSTPTCGCDCPEGFTGENCATPITPLKVKIENIRVTMWANTTPSGAFWDTFPDSTADLSVVMGRINASASPTLVWSSPINYSNVFFSTGVNSYDFTPTSPIIIGSVTTPHMLELFDYDGNETVPSANDTMGTVTFTPYIAANGFPTTIIVKDDSIPLSFELTVSYTW